MSRVVGFARSSPSESMPSVYDSRMKPGGVRGESCERCGTTLPHTSVSNLKSCCSCPSMRESTAMASSEPLCTAGSAGCAGRARITPSLARGRARSPAARSTARAPAQHALQNNCQALPMQTAPLALHAQIVCRCKLPRCNVAHRSSIVDIVTQSQTSQVCKPRESKVAMASAGVHGIRFFPKVSMA